MCPWGPCSNYTIYSAMYRHIQSVNQTATIRPVVMNSGLSYFDEAYMKLPNLMLVAFESISSTWSHADWVIGGREFNWSKYDRSRFAMITENISDLSAAVATIDHAAALHYGYFFCTPATADYSRLPPYWDGMVARIHSMNQAASNTDDAEDGVVPLTNRTRLKHDDTSFNVYWSVGTQGWKNKFGVGPCAPKNWDMSFGNVSLSALGILPSNWTDTGMDCCTPGCRRFNDDLPYVDPTAWEKHRKIVPKNGGVPQLVDMSAHLQKVRAGVAGWIPDPAWTGNAVFDFEAWVPMWELNHNYFGPGVMNRYHNLSLQIVQRQHPDWPRDQQLAEAKEQFQNASVNLLVQTLRVAKAVRPHAKWGFYGYPASCSEPWLTSKAWHARCKAVTSPKLAPLYREHTGFFPSIYMPKDKGHTMNSAVLRDYANGTVTAAVQMSRDLATADTRTPVLVYIWPRYANGSAFLTEEDLQTSLQIPWAACADGIVIWGSGHDANDTAFWAYTREKLGPALATMRAQPRACANTLLKLDDESLEPVTGNFPRHLKLNDGVLGFPGLGVSIAGRAPGWDPSTPPICPYCPDGPWSSHGENPASFLNLTFTLSDFLNSSAAGPWTLDTPDLHATITRSKEDPMAWGLSLTSKVAIHHASFPLLLNGTHLDDQDDLYLLMPFLGGAFVKDGSISSNDTGGVVGDISRTWDAPGLTYPGRLHAPYLMLCTVDECLMAASTNLPSRLSVRPTRNMLPKLMPSTPKRLALEHMEACLQSWNMIWCSAPNAFGANETTNISVILGSFRSDPTRHTAAWQSAVVAYRTWLRSHTRRQAPVVPEKMLAQEGMLQVVLESYSEFNLSALNESWNAWRDNGYGRLQFWGQMSSSLRDPSIKPGEKCGCCLMEYEMHPRYVKAGLPQWVKSQVAQGYDIGYYSQPKRYLVDGANGINQTAWIRGWLRTLHENYSANAYYIDTFGRGFEGSSQELLPLFAGGIFPPNSITEGWVDFVPFATLIDGYNVGWGWVRGPGYCNPGPCSPLDIGNRLRPWHLNNSGTYINLVRLLQGDTTTYYGVNDGEGPLCGPKHLYFCERQAFLLGSKVDTEKSSPYPFLLMIKTLRDSVNWWRRGMMYQDTMGVNNRHSDVLDVRRHDDTEGRIVLAVENWHNFSGLTVEFDGVAHMVDAAQLSVIEVNSTWRQ